MLNVQLFHSFLKDPLTEKLIRRYVPSPRARKVYQTSVHVVEILMVALPLLESATKGITDMLKSNKQKKHRAHTQHPQHRLREHSAN